MARTAVRDEEYEEPRLLGRKPVGTRASDKCYPSSSSEQLVWTRVPSGPFCELLGGIRRSHFKKWYDPCFFQEKGSVAHSSHAEIGRTRNESDHT